jgi:glutamyl-tRNA synthetase
VLSLLHIVMKLFLGVCILVLGMNPLNAFKSAMVPRKVISRTLSMAKVSNMAPVRVRFAPSPTGSLHVGGARTALFNWLLAKKTKGSFIVRVEDTDEARSTRESENMILGDLKWMNMNWDEGPGVEGPYGPYRQSERKDIYKKYGDQLIAQGKAFRCFCTPEELDEKRAAAEAAGLDPKYDGTWRNADPVEVQKKIDNGDPYTVRFMVPPGKVVSIDDIVRGKVTWDADASLGDFIILRSNGMPVYNFCVAVDDANMQVTHVIRAEEHLTNTLRQMLILEALGYRPPTYAHCSLILGQDRSKLSKRHGATSVSQFAEQGFLPQAMMNYLANLGTYIRMYIYIHIYR